MRCLVLLFVLAPLGASAQGLSLLGQGEGTGDLRVMVSALSIRYDEDGREPSQFAVPVGLDALLGGGVMLSARTSYAVTDGLGGDEVGGLGDLQLAASRPFLLGTASAVAGVSLNVPTGQGRLATAEAETAYLAGQTFYDFPLPTWGQGFNLAPSVAVAAPMGESLAVGAGVAWQYRGPFQPLTDGVVEFDPSDELIVTAGADVRLGASTVAAVDISYVAYGSDSFGEATFEAGQAFGVAAEVARVQGRSELRLSGRMFSRAGRSALPVAAAPESVVPLQGRLRAEARMPVMGPVSVGAVVQGRYYEASEAFSEKALLDLVVAPEVEAGSGLRVRPHAGITLGDLPGVRYGVSVTYGL